ncbi:MAG TPA: response regulator [Polyangia bacterium]|nr:response regulator [Polyangia bacterium]
MRSVVVADDNREMTMAVRLLLSRFGWNVIAAYDGVTALDAIRTSGAAVALVDIGLPKLDGLEVAKQIRADGSACRLVAMSGFGEARDRDLALGAGFDLHLVKPIEPAVLRAALEAATGPDEGGAR